MSSLSPELQTDRISDKNPIYQEVVQKLRAYDECDWDDNWADYSAFDLNEDTAKVLTQILEDDLEDKFNDENDELMCWVPAHAWRIISQKKYEKGLPALVDRLSFGDDDDFAHSDLPRAISAFGPAAIPFLKRCLREETIHGPDIWGVVYVLDAFGKIAEGWVKQKPAIAEILRESLSEFEVNPPTLNSFLITHLVDLGDKQALPLIQKVFARKFLDETIIDWKGVRRDMAEFGVLPEKIEVEKYNPNESHYSGDLLFQKLLKSIGSSFNVEELKCYVLVLRFFVSRTFDAIV